MVILEAKEELELKFNLKPLVISNATTLDSAIGNKFTNDISNGLSMLTHKEV